jgi:hypothetical protein
VNTGGGGDTVLVADAHQSLDALKSPLTIDGVDHNATLTLDDQGTAAAENYVIGWSPPSGNFLSRSGPPIIYRNVGTTTFDAGSPANTVDVQAIGDSATTINSGSGTSSVGVGDAAGGFVLSVGLPLTINGGSNHPTLTLDDQGNAGTSTYTLSAGEVDRSGSSPVDYSGVQSLTLHGGKANNTYRVPGAGDGTPTTITGGPGNDTFNLDVAPPNHLAPLVIDGGPGNDTLDLVDTRGTGLVRTIPNPTNPTSGMVTVAYPGGGGTVAVSYRNVETVDAVSDVTRHVMTQVFPDRVISLTSFGESLKVTNVSAQDILGNIRIVLHGLTFKTAPSRVLFGSRPLKLRFTATGDPFFSVPAGKLSAGKSLTVHLTFLKSIKVTGHLVIRVFAESLGP